MHKSAEAFRTISEVADELDVPKHVLRFWEVKFPQIRPMKRGGGRRYYRPQDVDLLRGIRRLLQAEAYTIKGVQKILREQGIEHVKGLGVGSEPESRAKSTAKRAAKESAQPAAARARPRGSRPDIRVGANIRAVLIGAIAELRRCRTLLTEGADPAPTKSNPTRPGA